MRNKMIDKIGKIAIMTIISLFAGIIVFSIIGHSEGDTISKDNIENNIIKKVNNFEQDKIIKIVDAEHLDKNKEFISDIYDKVGELDNVWSKEISDGEYIRIKFEQNLSYTRDINIYSRIVSGNPKIEVYEIDGNEKIAEFSNLRENDYTQVILTALKGAQDSFDLRVLGGSVEIENVIDPQVEQFFEDCVDLTDWTLEPSGGWASTGTACRSTNGVHENMTRSIDISGKTNTLLNFTWSVTNIDSGEFFRAYAGTSTSVLSVIFEVNGNGGTQSGNAQINITGNESTTTTIRFYCTSGGGERCDIEDINLSSFVDNPPTVNLLSPANGTTVTNETVWFSAHISDDVNAANATLYIWNLTSGGTLFAVNFTVVGNASMQVNKSISLNLTGTYLWNYLAVDSSSNQAFNESNFTLTFTEPVPAADFRVNITQSFSVGSSTEDIGRYSRRDFGSLVGSNAMGRIEGLFRASIATAILSAISGRAYLGIRNLEQILSINEVLERIKLVSTNIAQSFNVLNTLNRIGLFFRGLNQNIIINSILRAGSVVQNVVNIIQQFIITPIANTLSFFNRGLSGNFIIDSIVDRTKSVFTSITQNLNILNTLNRAGSFFRALTQQLIVNAVTATKNAAITLVNLIQQFIITPIANTLSFFNRGLSGNIIFNSIAGRTAFLRVGIFQPIDLDALLSRIYLMVRNPAQILSINEVLERVKIVFANIVQNLNILNTLNRAGSFFRALTQQLIINTQLATRSIVRTTINIIQQFIITPIANTLSFFNRGLTGNFIIDSIVGRTKTVLTSLSQNLNILNTLNRAGSFFRALTQQVIVNAVLITKNAAINLVNIIQNFIIRPIANTLSFFNRGLSGNVIVNAITTRTKSVFTSINQQINLIANLVRNLFGFSTLTGNVAITTVAGRSFGITTNIFQLIDLEGIAKRVYTVVRNPIAIFKIDNIIDKKSFFFRIIEALLRIIGIGIGPPEPEPTPAPTPTPVPSGGVGESGSGSGGATGAVIKTAKSFYIDESEIKVILKEGETKKASFTVINDGNEKLDFIVRRVGLQEYITQYPRLFSLESGKSEVIELVIIPPKNPGIYTAKIVVETGGIQKELPVVIELETKKKLFDIKLDVPAEYTEVLAGESIPLTVTLFNIGLAGVVDVNIVFRLKDLEDNIILETEEIIAVETRASLYNEMVMPDNLETGKYVITAEIRYADTVSTASYVVSVVKKKIGLETVIFYMAFLLAGIIAVIILFNYYNNRASSERKRLAELLRQGEMALGKNDIGSAKIIYNIIKREHNAREGKRLHGEIIKLYNKIIDEESRE